MNRASYEIGPGRGRFDHLTGQGTEVPTVSNATIRFPTILLPLS
jgi:hypothetical protein